MSEYLRKNIQPVIQLDLGLDTVKCVNGSILNTTDRNLMQRSNPSLSGADSSTSDSSEITTTNSAKGLV